LGVRTAAQTSAQAAECAERRGAAVEGEVASARGDGLHDLGVRRSHGDQHGQDAGEPAPQEDAEQQARGVGDGEANDEGHGETHDEFGVHELGSWAVEDTAAERRRSMKSSGWAAR